MKLLSFTQKNNYKMTKAWIGPFSPVILVSHSDVAGKLLKRRYFYSYLVPWLGEGLLISKGKKWQRNRHLLTPAFHYQILKAYVPIVNSCLEVFLKKWTGVANDGVSVYAFKDVGKLSLDVIMRCAFSTESNCQLSEDHLYIKSISDMIHLLNDRIPNLIYNSDLIYSLTSDGKKFNQACKIAHNFTESVIRERKKALEIGDSEEKRETEAVLRRASKQRKYLDFLDILLTACDEDGKGLTDLEIRDEVDTFMFAGHDTTTSGISWTLYCLAKHPEHQDKIREEVRDILMGREWLEYDDLKELNYTQWCIKEAMRLYPPAPRLCALQLRRLKSMVMCFQREYHSALYFFRFTVTQICGRTPTSITLLISIPAKLKDGTHMPTCPFQQVIATALDRILLLLKKRWSLFR